jgi:hypothetical protein
LRYFRLILDAVFSRQIVYKDFRKFCHTSFFACLFKVTNEKKSGRTLETTVFAARLLQHGDKNVREG